MTPKEFTTWAQGYYGPYPVGQKRDIAEWLIGRWPEELDELKAEMLKACPSHIGQVNGYPPDIEAMEKLLPAVQRSIAARLREEREKALASRMLPAPEEATTNADLMALDWSKIFQGKIKSVKKSA